jgi:hypothetical protein
MGIAFEVAFGTVSLSVVTGSWVFVVLEVCRKLDERVRILLNLGRPLLLFFLASRTSGITGSVTLRTAMMPSPPPRIGGLPRDGWAF